jgi:hypothetical protein
MVDDPERIRGALRLIHGWCMAADKYSLAGGWATLLDPGGWKDIVNSETGAWD